VKRTLVMLYALALVIALALANATQSAVTQASFVDVETAHGNTFSAFGPGPPGICLKPGGSKCCCGMQRQAASIATTEDGSVALDFGDVTFGGKISNSDVFRVSNRSGVTRTFRIGRSASLDGLLADAVAGVDGVVRSGSEVSVGMALDAGARPPGTYTGSLTVSDASGEFFRVVRVTVRILETHHCSPGSSPARPDERAPMPKPSAESSSATSDAAVGTPPVSPDSAPETRPPAASTSASETPLSAEGTAGGAPR
jgi:hypothetical protein